MYQIEAKTQMKATNFRWVLDNSLIQEHSSILSIRPTLEMKSYLQWNKHTSIFPDRIWALKRCATGKIPLRTQNQCSRTPASRIPISSSTKYLKSHNSLVMKLIGGLGKKDCSILPKEMELIVLLIVSLRKKIALFFRKSILTSSRTTSLGTSIWREQSLRSFSLKRYNCITWPRWSINLTPMTLAKSWLGRNESANATTQDLKTRVSRVTDQNQIKIGKWINVVSLIKTCYKTFRLVCSKMALTFKPCILF